MDFLLPPNTVTGQKKKKRKLEQTETSCDYLSKTSLPTFVRFFVRDQPKEPSTITSFDSSWGS